MRQSGALTIITTIILGLFILSFSIAVPILVRQFYYVHIGALELSEKTGLTKGEIKEAYDDMMDYCIGKTDEFSVGVLRWSQEGKDHFTDVRYLFVLDLVVMSVSGIALVLMYAIARRLKIKAKTLFGRGPLFWGPMLLAAAFIIIGIFAAVDFDKAFTVFHHIFFPGKTNWAFDPMTDPIILFLPQVFFRNCAILILSVMVILCGVMIFLDRVVRRKRS